MIFKMRNQHYLFIALVVLITFFTKINAQELEEESNEVSNMIAEDTADVVSRIVGTGDRAKRSDSMYYMDDSAEDISKSEGTGERLKRSDELSQEDTAEDISKNEEVGERVKRSKENLDYLMSELAQEVPDVDVDVSDKDLLRPQRSVTHVKRLLDDLDESKRKRSNDKGFRNRPAVKKRNTSKQKKNKESAVVDNAEDQAGKQKIKRKAREEMRHMNIKKGRKRRSKEKKHVRTRCTEPSACNSCQTTTEEFTLPTTTESECCETKPKCKPTTTKCKTTTTPCDSCDTCLGDEEQDNHEQ